MTEMRTLSRYERGNLKTYIEEGQTMQWSKKK